MHLTPFKTYSQHLLDIVLPHYCPLCETKSTRFFCAECTRKLPRIHNSCIICDVPLNLENTAFHAIQCPECIASPPSFNQVICALEYSTITAFAIQHFKQHGNPHYAKALCEVLLERIETVYLNERTYSHQKAILVPVPAHWRTQMKRGFNQSTYIAEQLAKSLELPVKHLLKKHSPTSSQKSLGRKARERNMQNSMCIDKNISIPEYVILIDDIVTTGATVNSAANHLKNNGVKRVDVWALARTPKEYNHKNK